MSPIAGFGQGYNTLLGTLRQLGERVSADAAVVADPNAGTPERTVATVVDLSKLKLQAGAAAIFFETIDELSATLLQIRRK
jgi:hypothetical protein